MRLLLLLGVCVLWCISFACGHTFEGEHICNHDEVMQGMRKRNAMANLRASQNYTDDDFPRANNTKPIRIFIDKRYMDNDDKYTCYSVGAQITRTDSDSTTTVYTCTAEDILTSEQRAYLEDVLLPQSTARLAQLLGVVPIQGNLYAQPMSYCGKLGVAIPSSYLKSGGGVPDADLAVFVTTRPTSNGVLAYALSCQDDQHYRSVVGLINVDPGSIKTSVGLIVSQVATIKHELTHVLGLSNSKYGNFRLPPAPGQVGDKYYNAQGVSGYINSTEVVKWTRAYYGCDSLVGMRLEDNGSGGTAASHWEKTWVMNEYMTGSTVRDPVISKLTLAFFQDSGWYWPNYDAADFIEWGYQRGCSFTESCANWPEGDGYRCSVSDKSSECTFDLQGIGICDESDALAPGCPYIRGYSDRWCIDPLDAGKTSPFVNNGEVNGATSRCYTSSLLKNAPAGVESRVCYPTTCVSPTDMRVQVGGYWHTCPKGETTAVMNYGGEIDCPDPQKVCLGQPDRTNLWPLLLFVVPDKGEPGTVITITGKYFTNVTSVYIAGPCTGVTVIDDGTVIATLPKYDKIKNPTNFLKGANIYMVSSNGYNSFNYKKFTLEIKLSKDLLKAIGKWLAAHFYVPIIIGLIILALILACWCCHRDSVKIREKRFLKQQKREMTNIEAKQRPAARNEVEMKNVK